jgi:hypothetical protein
MKKIVYNLEDFIFWINDQKNKYSIYNKKKPNEFPCIIVSHTIENDYFDTPDWLDFDFVYKNDFED